MGHMLQLIVKKVIDVLKSAEEQTASNTNKFLLKEIIRKCKDLTLSFNHSSQLSEKLVESQIKFCEDSNIKPKSLKLIQEVCTRWHSLFLCLNRIKECHTFIDQVNNKILF